MLREYGRQIVRAWMSLDVILSAAVFLALLAHPSLRRFDSFPDTLTGSVLVVGALASLGWPLLLNRAGVYRWNRRQPMSELLARLALANAVGALVLSTAAFALAIPVAPIFPLLLAAVMFCLQASIRVPVFFLLRSIRRRGRNFRNVLIIGAGPRAREAKETIERHPEWGLRIIGYVDDGEGNFVPSVPHDQIHKLIDLPKLLREETVDETLVACPRRMLESLDCVVNECALIGVPVTLLTDLFGVELPPPRVGHFDRRGTLSYAPVHHNDFALAMKRGLDIVGAGIGLALAAPFLGVAAAAIKLTSPGPVLFHQVRCGVNGRRFMMPKLRTMVVDAEALQPQLAHLNEMDGPVFKIKDDPRVTPIGRFLRKWSIDELPQFWSVLVGDMSLVGPRPPIPSEVVQYQGSERRRLSMRPGLTCLWQVSGRNDVQFDEWMRLDLEYIDTWSMSQDFRILLRTLPQVLFARGSS
jgi:exopolysaccharide biosynthesis polyprenyl glycosylphosphotransferase